MLLSHSLLFSLVSLVGVSAQQPRLELRSAAASQASESATPLRFQVRTPLQDSHRPGRLGLQIQPDDGSVRVGGVVEGSAAQRAALRAGDQVVGFEGRDIQNVDQLVESVRSRSAGTEVQLRIRRTTRVALDPARLTPDGRPALGVYLGAGPDELVITRIEAGYPAARSDLRAGDRIVSLGGGPLKDYDQLVARMRDLDAGQPLELAVERDVRVRLDSASEDALRVEPRRDSRSPQRLAAPAPVPLSPDLARPSEFERQLASEVRALTADLRELREELARLREELSSKPRRRR